MRDVPRCRYGIATRPCAGTATRANRASVGQTVDGQGNPGFPNGKNRMRFSSMAKATAKEVFGG